MTPQFIEEFSFLLDSGRDGIEVSYNAAGVLSHIASDGLAAWTVEAPDREHVLERLVRAVNRCKSVVLQTIHRFHNRFSQSRRRLLLGPFSWLKAPTSAFTFNTLLRHNAKQALNPW